jgi:hypothetical protein
MPIKLLIIIGSILASLAIIYNIGYHSGKNDMQNVYLKQLSGISGQLKQQELATQDANMKLAEALNKKQIVTEIKYKTLYKDRIQYVKENPDINVNVSTWWVLYLNAAFGNTDMPDAGYTDRVIAANPTIAIDRIADQVIFNTQLYYDCKNKLDAWQKWYLINYELRKK